jgi:hypothetical protein
VDDTRAESQEPTRSAFDQARARCEHIGFSAFVVPAGTGNPSAHLLKTHYVRMQSERLLVDGESPVE